MSNIKDFDFFPMAGGFSSQVKQCPACKSVLILKDKEVCEKCKEKQETLKKILGV